MRSVESAPNCCGNVTSATTASSDVERAQETKDNRSVLNNGAKVGLPNQDSVQDGDAIDSIPHAAHDVSACS